MLNSSWPPNQLFAFCKRSAITSHCTLTKLNRVIFRLGLHLWSSVTWPELSHSYTCCLQHLIMSSCFTGYLYVTACYSSIQPLACWLPGASNESFIKASVSCADRLFSQPNCLRMDDLSEGPEEIETSVSIIRRLWHTHTHTHTKGDKENMYIQACILCSFSSAVPAEFLRPRALCQDLAQYWMYWLWDTRSFTARHRCILELCVKALPRLVEVIRHTIQNHNE